ncbi:GerAB/ArcD/ProY family transporter [Paenibacillus daejeonensis]|uniref:GerAB/ArcD/ProY family transporter n=1 Tax=Paenibacillus daejeonensis TaxID=135193 RepID=UPI00037C09FB|nr:endospore germination permease [Paenibacillus daejeonensis]
MLEPGKISIRQLTVLFYLAMIGDMIIILPPIAAGYAHQNGWIVALASIPMGMVLVWLMLKLAAHYPDSSLVQICERILGRWLGGLVSVTYLIFFVIAGSIYVREVGDFLTTQLFANTPIRYIHLLFIATLLWAIWHGLESIARSAELLLPLFILIYIVLILCLLPEIEVSRLKPILGEDHLWMLRGTMLTTFYPFGEMIVFLMVIPYVQHQKHLKRDVLLASLLAGLTLALIIFISLTVLGSFFTQHNIYATYTLTQKINIGGFLQRIEALMAAAWVLTTFLKSCLFFYAFALGTAQLFKLRSTKPLYVPTTFIIFGLSLLVATDVSYYLNTIVPFWIDWNLTYSLLFPLLLLAIHHIRNRKKSVLPG